MATTATTHLWITRVEWYSFAIADWDGFKVYRDAVTGPPQLAELGTLAAIFGLRLSGTGVFGSFERGR
jgi:hypothetical protein